MFSSFLLWVVVATLGGLNDKGLRFPLAKGLTVCIAPESQQFRYPVAPGLGIDANGKLYFLYERLSEFANPVAGLFNGNPDGTPQVIGVRFLDEGRTGMLAVVAGLWRLKQFSEAGWILERTSSGWLTSNGWLASASGPPNALICLYSQTLDLWRSAAGH